MLKVATLCASSSDAEPHKGVNPDEVVAIVRDPGGVLQGDVKDFYCSM